METSKLVSCRVAISQLIYLVTVNVAELLT